MADAPERGKTSSPLRLDAGARRLLRRFLVEWVQPRWRELSLAFVLTGLLAAASAAYPLIVKHSADALLAGRTDALPLVLAAVIGATLFRSLFLYLQTVATNRIILRMMIDIQKLAFRRLITADFARLTRETPGRLVSRLTNDMTFIQQASQAALNSAVRDTLVVLSLIAAMLYLDWAMTLIVVGVYPLAVLPIMMIGRRLRRVARRTQNELGGMTSLLTEKLSSARLIKVFRLEAYASERMSRSFDQIYALRLKAVRSRARLDPILEMLGGLAIAGVVAFAAWRITSGQASIGDFAGFVVALLTAAQPIRALGSLSTKVQEGLAAAERLYEILDEQPAIFDRADARPLATTLGTVAFEDVSFSYNGIAGVEALKGVSLDVAGGTTVALVGRSGSGKSTLINLVPRMFDVTGGRILIDGQDIRDVTLASLRDAIAVVSQDVTLFDDTIRANIALGRLGASDADIVAAAKAAAAHEFIMAQPDGYDSVVGDRGMRLSGGQRQRLALARAILKDAPILLLDEATSALDTESEGLVQAALARFTVSRTTLVIAHRLSTVQNAQRICVMEAGRIVEMGTHAELMTQAGAYARLSRTQMLAGPEQEAAQ